MFAISETMLVVRLWEWSSQLATAFTWFGLPLLGWATIASYRTKRLIQWPLWLTAVFTLIYALGYNTFDAQVLLLPTLLLLALLLTNGLQSLGPFALLLPLAMLLLHLPTQNLRHAPTWRPTATGLLQEAPPNAILLTPGDTTIFYTLVFPSC